MFPPEFCHIHEGQKCLSCQNCLETIIYRFTLFLKFLKIFPPKMNFSIFFAKKRLFSMWRENLKWSPKFLRVLYIVLSWPSTVQETRGCYLISFSLSKSKGVLERAFFKKKHQEFCLEDSFYNVLRCIYREKSQKSRYMINSFLLTCKYISRSVKAPVTIAYRRKKFFFSFFCSFFVF